MLQFSLTAGPGNAVTWTGVTFTASGTGDESADVTLAELWEDTDNDGAPDSPIGSGETYATDNGTISWTTLTETIATSSTKYYILTYDFNATADGTFHVEIANITTDVTAQVGVDTITPTGTSPVAGPTITVDSTPPYVVRAMFEGADPTTPVAGDTITVYFSETIATTAVADTDFVLPNTPASDDLGTGATCAAEGSNAILITLGTGPILTIPGTFVATTPNLGPSGIDVDSPVTSITDAVGNAAEQLSPPGVDIKAKFIPDGTAVTDLEVNVLSPEGEQSGDINGHVMIQYFVAKPSAMANITLTVEFDDGTGFEAATEGTAIFTNAGFAPSDTGDLRIYSWYAVTDFAAAGSGGDNDPVTLRFTFDPNTPAVPDDDFVDEVTFNLDNKPQAVATPPHVNPARKTAFLDASDSWVPGGLSTVTDYTWTFSSVPGGSALLDADITKTTAVAAHPMVAYFQPDVAGDYVLDLYVTSGSPVDSNVVVTTVHALAPDNFTGANEASYVLPYDIDPDPQPMFPGHMAYDETGKNLLYTSDNTTCFGQDLGYYFPIATSIGRFDTTTLPAAVSATSPVARYINYDRDGNEFIFPVHMDSYNNGSSIAVSYQTYTVFWDGATTYNVGLSATNDDPFRNILNGNDWHEWEQALISMDDNPPFDGSAPNDWLMAWRIAQVERGGNHYSYWLADQRLLSGSDLVLVQSWLIEIEGAHNDSGGTMIDTPTYHDAVSFPTDTMAYDVVVQLSGTPTAWVTCPTSSGSSAGVYYVDLSGGVGALGTPTLVAGYTGVRPAEMVLDENNGYLFVSNRGNANANGSISVIDLSTRTVVTEVNMPGDYTVRELAIDTVADPSLLFGTDSLRDMVHVIEVDYLGGGTTPLLTCLPSVDTSLHPKDVIYEQARQALFVSENANNTILTAQPGGTGWVFDHDAGLDGGGDELNADWAADPISGDLCMAFQRGPNGGIWFARTADGGKTWTGLIRVDDNTGTVIGDPDIAVDAWGTIVVVWADDTNTDFDVFMKRSDDGGATWDGSQIKVNTEDVATDTTDQGDPCVTIDFLGNILVAFESSDGANVAIKMVKGVGHQRWTYFGPVDSNIVVSTPSTFDCSDPDIAFSPYDPYLPDVWVVWSDTRGASANIMTNWTNTTFGSTTPESGMRLDFLATDIAVGDTVSGDAVKPRCAWDSMAATGVLVVVWEQDRGNGAGIYSDEGGKAGFGTDVVVEEPSAPASGTCNNPYLSIHSFNVYNVNISARAVAYESDLKTGNKDAYWELAQNDGGWEGEGMRMNAVMTNAQTRPLVHVFSGNNYITIWEDGRIANKDFYTKRQ
jgi:hypothetical protein